MRDYSKHIFTYLYICTGYLYLFLNAAIPMYALRCTISFSSSGARYLCFFVVHDFTDDSFFAAVAFGVCLFRLSHTASWSCEASKEYSLSIRLSLSLLLPPTPTALIFVGHGVPKQLNHNKQEPTSPPSLPHLFFSRWMSLCLSMRERLHLSTFFLFFFVLFKLSRCTFVFSCVLWWIDSVVVRRSVLLKEWTRRAIETWIHTPVLFDSLLVVLLR